MRTIIAAATFVMVLAGTAFAGECPRQFTSSTPFIKLPCPKGDARWSEAFGHWDKRAEKDEALAAVKVFESILADNPDMFEARLWVARSYYAAGMKYRGDEQVAWMKKCSAAFDKVLEQQPNNDTALYWKTAAMIFFHDFSEADYKKAQAFGARYSDLRELPVPGDDPLWKEAISHWDKRYAYDEGLEAIKVFEKLEKKSPGSIEPKLWLLRAHYWMHYIEKEKDKKAEWCKSAAEWGEKALEIEPRNPSASYLTASAYGQYGSNTSFVNYVRYAPSITDKLLVTMEEDPNYFYGGVSQYFALAIARAGSVVAKMLDLMGFSEELIMRNTVYASHYEPRYLRNHYALGELYLQQGKKDEAKKMLEKTINGDPSALKNMEAENKVAQDKARKLLEDEFK